MKEVALQEGANVNVDETWCRYQTHFGHRKTYMWCLVNRALGIVIFFYEDTTDENGVKHEGGRGRNVLLDFLGDAKIKSLQSDGYNVYTYLDGELIDIEHLCCSTKGAVNSAIYNTFIETCKQAGISFREYFRRVILELKHGRTDYARSNLFACYQRDARTCFR